MRTRHTAACRLPERRQGPRRKEDPMAQARLPRLDERTPRMKDRLYKYKNNGIVSIVLYKASSAACCVGVG